MKNYTIDIIIPTYKPDETFYKLIERLEKQTVTPNKIIIINTEEQFFDSERYVGNPLFEVIHINKEEFDHGGTRNFGAGISQADIIMFMTQDALPENSHMVEKILQPFKDDEVAAVYGRQLANKNASEIERYTRRFNYPNTDSVKSIEDIERLGIKTYFCSNVCAAYRMKDYKLLGGFVTETIFNEDMIMASKVINNGKKIAYAKDARVMHSHEYSWMKQLNRNFDLGVSHKQYKEIFGSVKSESEGVKLVKDTAKHLIKIQKWYLIPDLIIQSAFKYMGYKLGYNYERLPDKMVKALSMNKSYWDK